MHFIIKLVKILMLSLLGIHLAFGQVQNAGFEETAANGKPRTWFYNNPDSVNNRIQLSTVEKFSGQQSLEMIKRNDQAPLIVSTSIPITTDKISKLRISAKVKTNTEEILSNFYLQTFDQHEKRIGGSGKPFEFDPNKKGQWQTVDFTILIDPKVKSGVLFLVLGSKGELWVDDVETEWITGAPSAKSKAFASEILKLMKENSIVRDSVDWNLVDQELSTMLAGAKADNDDEDIANYLLGFLRAKKDFHSFYSNPKRHQQNIAKPNSGQQKELGKAQPNGKLLPEGVAYVQVPAVSTLNPEGVQAYADTLNNIILNLQQQNPKGWIVDLTNNTGGNMYPMIAGLSALIQPGKLLSFVRKDGESPVFMEAQGFSKIILTNPPKQREDKKIAILITPKTASSGEMTLLSLLSMPKAKSFGLPTAGFTSANSVIPLSNGGALALASSIVRDYSGKLIVGNIAPMVPVQAKTFDDLQNAAIKWILE